MADKNLNTEQKIILAAKHVFVEKGYEGARMQEISDRAGINKALLHYYFRSKEKLFEGVFREAFFAMVPDVISLLKQNIPLFDKIQLFCEKYIEIFIDNRFIPGFVVNELNRNPERMVGLISNIGISPEIFIDQINEEVEKGHIYPIDPPQLIVNMLSMCIFPFVAAPLLTNIIFKGDQDSFTQFIEDRKKSVPEFIINSIKKND